jgi:site-specific DNA-cytosine methylase
MMEHREIRVFHMCSSIGAAAKGMNKGSAKVGNLVAKFRTIGGVDCVPSVLRDFKRLTGCDGTLLDLFTLEQYVDFHGKQPPPAWREATPADIHRACGYKRPHVVFMSAPCKGFSGLLSQSCSESTKYQALNQLALRCVWLVLEAYKDDPPEILLFENVPRIATRGRALLDHIEQLLSAYGYASAETTHDCGELGGLAQSRKRFLLVARHVEKVPPFLYQPHKRPLRAVGEVLGKMRLPGDPAAGPMHRIPKLHWKTWVRLAFVESGKDWRSLQRLEVQDGYLRDYAIMPEADYHSGVYGVHHWQDTAGTVCAQAGPSNGAFSVADPRVDGDARSVQLGVRGWHQPAATVTASMWAGTGPNSVADPRIAGVKHNNCFRVVRWSEVSPSVTGGTGPSAGGLAVGDPRPGSGWSGAGKYRVSSFSGPAGTVIAESHTGNGAFAVADPRSGLERGRGSDFASAGHYGVVPWNDPAGAVTSSLQHDSGRGNVADPRLPQPSDRPVAVIRAEDGTWHRPFTTLELAALQSLFDPEEDESFILDGNSDSAWREHIGNAVPPDASQAIADVIGRTLLLAWSGETFVLASTPVWVRPIAIALSVMQRRPA